MAPRRYSFGFAGQNFDFELPEIGEGETEQTRSVLASYFPELRLRYGMKTQRGGRLGRDVTPVEKEVTFGPTAGGAAGTTVNVGGPTATATVEQPAYTAPPTPAAPTPTYTGPDYSEVLGQILGAVSAPKPAEEPTPAVETAATPTAEETTPATPTAPQFTGNVGGVSYQALGSEKFSGKDVQAALQAGYDPGSVLGYAASLPKSELSKAVKKDLKAAGFTLGPTGAYGGTLPSAPTAAQTFLDKSIGKQLGKSGQAQVAAAVTRAQGLSVAPTSTGGAGTTIASPFTYVAPTKSGKSKNK